MTGQAGVPGGSPDGNVKGERRYWLDEPRHVDWIVYTLYGVCAALIGIDLLLPRQVHFAFEKWLGFYGFYGFIGCVMLVLIAKVLRLLVKRPEDYYEGRGLFDRTRDLFNKASGRDV